MPPPSSPPSTPSLAILAGGASTRMGRDKTALTIDGETVLARLCRAGAACGLPIVVIGRDAATGPIAGVTWIADTVPGQGPLGGVATALATVESALVVGCDMPGVGERQLSWLRDRAAEHDGDDALLCETPGGLEPLFSWYHRRLAPAIARRLHDNQRALHSLSDEPRVARLSVPAWLAPALINVNTPEEWASFLARPRL